MIDRLSCINISLLCISLLITNLVLILCKLHDTCSKIVNRGLSLKAHHGEQFGLMVLETKYCLDYIGFPILIFGHK